MVLGYDTVRDLGTALGSGQSVAVGRAFLPSTCAFPFVLALG
jgi:hypothetical protein